MKVLVCGAHGTLGRAIAERLVQRGHQVIGAVRRPREAGEIAVEYRRDVTSAAWLPRVMTVDAVVNAVGILRESARHAQRDGLAERFDALHRDAPAALFEACRLAGGRRIVQISALGADADTGSTRFLRSKGEADRLLLAMPGDALVVRPSQVFDPDGRSTRLFATLASLPLHLLPGDGRQPLRPVHRDDLAALVVRWLESGAPGRTAIDVVGDTDTTCRDLLATYRAAMGWPPARALALPAPLVGVTAAVCGQLPGTLFDRDTWTMLRQGSTADVAATTAALGHRPRGVAQFLSGADAARLRAQALATIRTPLLRAALAFVWLWTAWVSAFVFPREVSLARLGATGLHGAAAALALYGACALDALLGVLTLAWPRRRLWLAQFALVAAYTAAIACTMPAQFAEPFGPLIKNAPILAILLVLIHESAGA